MQNPSRRSVLLAGLAAAETAAGAAACSSTASPGTRAPRGRRRRIRPHGGRRHRRRRTRRAHRRARAHPARQVGHRPRGPRPRRRAASSTTTSATAPITEVGGEYIGPTQDRIAALAKRRRRRHLPDLQRGPERPAARRQAHDLPGDRPADRPSIAPSLLKTSTALDAMSKTVPVDQPWTAPKAEEWDAQTLRDVPAQPLIQPRRPRAHRRRGQVDLGRGGGRPLPAVRALLHRGGRQRDDARQLPAAGHDGRRLAGAAVRRRLAAGRRSQVAKALGDRVVLSAPVRRIEQTDQRRHRHLRRRPGRGPAGSSSRSRRR